MLIGSHLDRKYQGMTVLEDVSATIVPGELTVAIGPSGSGKSTLLRCLSLLEPPDRGTITVDEMVYQFPVAEDNSNPAPPWPDVCVVFQSLFLWPNLTVRENIELPLKNRHHIDRHKVIDELCHLYNMHDYIDRYPNQASVGQRQRAALARAVAIKPKYLLLDEVTSALDVEYVAVVLNHLLELKKQGTGIFLVTHLIGFARRAAEHVLFLEGSRVMEAGSREILTQPKTERLARFLSLVSAAT